MQTRHKATILDITNPDSARNFLARHFCLSGQEIETAIKKLANVKSFLDYEDGEEVFVITIGERVIFLNHYCLVQQ